MVALCRVSRDIAGGRLRRFYIHSHIHGYPRAAEALPKCHFIIRKFAWMYEWSLFLSVPRENVKQKEITENGEEKRCRGNSTEVWNKRMIEKKETSLNHPPPWKLPSFVKSDALHHEPPLLRSILRSASWAVPLYSQELVYLLWSGNGKCKVQEWWKPQGDRYLIPFYLKLPIR